VAVLWEIPHGCVRGQLQTLFQVFWLPPSAVFTQACGPIQAEIILCAAALLCHWLVPWPGRLRLRELHVAWVWISSSAEYTNGFRTLNITWMPITGRRQPGRTAVSVMGSSDVVESPSDTMKATIGLSHLSHGRCSQRLRQRSALTEERHDHHWLFDGIRKCSGQSNERQGAWGYISDT
jgi:hypothetical protein